MWSGRRKSGWPHPGMGLERGRTASYGVGRSMRYRRGNRRLCRRAVRGTFRAAAVGKRDGAGCADSVAPLRFGRADWILRRLRRWRERIRPMRSGRIPGTGDGGISGGDPAGASLHREPFPDVSSGSRRGGIRRVRPIRAGRAVRCRNARSAAALLRRSVWRRERRFRMRGASDFRISETCGPFAVPFPGDACRRETVGAFRSGKAPAMRFRRVCRAGVRPGGAYPVPPATCPEESVLLRPLRRG